MDNAFACQCVYVLMGTAVMLVIPSGGIYSPVGRHGKNGSLAGLFIICLSAPGLILAVIPTQKSYIHLFVPGG